MGMFFLVDIFPTQDKNQPKAGFCPSGFINFALPKNLCTYQVISNITYGVVNFPKIGAKSSKPFGNFFCRLGNFFWRLAVLFSNAGQKPAEGWFLFKWVYKFLPSQKLVHLSGYFKHHIGGGQLPKNRCEIL